MDAQKRNLQREGTARTKTLRGRAAAVLLLQGQGGDQGAGRWG